MITEYLKLYLTENGYLFSQHMTQPCKSMRFARFSFAFEHFLKRFIFAVFRLTQTVTHTEAWSGTDRTENQDGRTSIT